jgi:hypothetical protein
MRHLLIPALLGLAPACGSTSEATGAPNFAAVTDSGTPPGVADSGSDSGADAPAITDYVTDGAALPDSGFCSGEIGPLTAAQAADAGVSFACAGLCVPCVCPGGANGPGSDASGFWVPNFACMVPNGTVVSAENAPDQ